MTESKETDRKKPLSLSRPGKLELQKTVDAGQVRQSFSHGRSKMVTVEVRKKRTFAPDSGGHMAEIRHDPQAVFDAGVKEAAEQEGGQASSAFSLTNEEKAARARALEGAHLFGDADALPPPTSAALRQVAEEPVEDEKEKDARRAEEEEARKREDEEARKREDQAKLSAAAAAAKLEAREKEEKDTDDKTRGRRPIRPEVRRPAPSSRRGEPRRRAGKLTISQALEGTERTRSLASVKRAREKQKQQQQLTEGKKIVRDVIIPETITVADLADRMSERGTDVIRVLMKMDVMATINQTIDADTAELVATELGHNFKRVSAADVEIGLKGEEDDPASLKPRAPVVTVMGHVDHGKTSLLDALRKTDVVSGEAGGITQHIGAYQVTLSSGAKITFIDTPGHAAFTDMRARGAQATDIVVLVVAADDGIMPQTVEAIHHAQAAGVPIIVAINKMDMPDADAGRVRTDLLQHNLVVEEMGGEVLSVEVSAKEMTNLDKLEEAILLQTEILDLKSNPDRNAEGVVIEARIERGRGTVATILVQRGTLNIGDIVVAGGEWGRVRAMTNDRGQSVETVSPGTPVEVVGLNSTPAAGDEVAVVDSESRAREVTEFRQQRERDIKAAATARGSLEQMFEKIESGEAETMPVVVKADVHGSVEAIVSAITKMGTEEVEVKVLHAGVGGINESDITLARASNAVIIGFNVRANPQARDTAKRDGVEIRYYSIIYDVMDDVKKVLSGMLAPTIRETLLGYAEIREVFNVSKVGKVAGCMVTEGLVRKGAKVRLLRDDVVIHEGALSQLKRFKDDAREVKEATECGMAFANYQDLQAGDRIECFETEEVAREL